MYRQSFDFFGRKREIYELPHGSSGGQSGSTSQKGKSGEWNNLDILHMYLEGSAKEDKNQPRETKEGRDIVPLRTREALAKLHGRVWHSLAIKERIALATLDVERDLYYRFCQLQEAEQDFGRPVREAGFLPSLFLGTQREAVKDGKRAIEGDIKVYKDLWYDVKNSDHFFRLALQRAEQARMRGNAETWQNAIQECKNGLEKKLVALHKAREAVGMIPWDFDKVVLTETDEQDVRNRASAKGRGTPGLKQAARGFAYQQDIDAKLRLQDYEDTLRTADRVMEWTTKAIDLVSSKLFGKKANAQMTYRLAKYLTEIPAELLVGHEVELRTRMTEVAVKIARDPEIQATLVEEILKRVNTDQGARMIVDILLSEEGRTVIRWAHRKVSEK